MIHEQRVVSRVPVGSCRAKAALLVQPGQRRRRRRRPAPTGLMVGSGNFFSPIVGDLDKAIAFYRDGLGLDVAGAPANADANPALRNMFGLPDAQLRWSIGRPPAMRTGVEIVEIKKAAASRSNGASRTSARSR